MYRRPVPPFDMITCIINTTGYNVQAVSSICLKQVRWSCDEAGVAIVLKVLTDTNSSGQSVHMHVHMAGSMAKDVPGPGGQATGVWQT